MLTVNRSHERPNDGFWLGKRRRSTQSAHIHPRKSASNWGLSRRKGAPGARELRTV